MVRNNMLHGLCFSNILSPARSHLTEFPQPLKKGHQLGTMYSKQELLGVLYSTRNKSIFFILILRTKITKILYPLQQYLCIPKVNTMLDFLLKSHFIYK